MPKQLDTEAREREVVAAAWRVIARNGVAALTVRGVATEAGLAPSSLRYSFPTQDAVREAAMRALGRRIEERIAALPDDAPPAERALAALLELLPLDAERRLEMEVFLALGMAALTDDALRPHWVETGEALRDVCAGALALLVETPTRMQIDHLHALVDGLAMHVLVAGDRTDGTWAREVMEAHLAGLL